jgi:hypothetical protein
MNARIAPTVTQAAPPPSSTMLYLPIAIC